MSRSVLASFLFLPACMALASTPASADVAPWGAKSTIARVSKHPLQPDQKKAFRSFRSACCYFSAYAINTDRDVGYFVQGFNGLRAAIDSAELGCAEVSREEKADPGKCRLYAYGVPAEVDIHDMTAKGLGAAARQGFVNDYTKSQTATGYGAFATGAAVGWGGSWNWPNAADAQDAALAHCASAVARVMAEITPAGREFARRKGLDRCSVVHQTAPGS